MMVRVISCNVQCTFDGSAQGDMSIEMLTTSMNLLIEHSISCEGI
jgi:hypothetical protein